MLSRSCGLAASLGSKARDRLARGGINPLFVEQGYCRCFCPDSRFLDQEPQFCEFHPLQTGPMKSFQWDLCSIQIIEGIRP
jgi:hypothetical protein